MAVFAASAAAHRGFQGLATTARADASSRPGNFRDLTMIYRLRLAVSPGVVRQAPTGPNQRQIRIAGLPVTPSKKNGACVLARFRWNREQCELRVGDTHAAWRSHAVTVLQVASFDAVYGALAAQPGVDVEVDAEVELARGVKTFCTAPPRSPSPRTASVVVPADVETNGRDYLLVGIDVGGRLEKGYDLCYARWRGGVLVEVQFKRVPHPVALSLAQLKPMVAEGDLKAFAEATIVAAVAVSAGLAEVLSGVRSRATGMFIDSPSAFSRNEAGHGRRTEKESLDGVSPQSTPSIACGREHGGDWRWLVYGMIAFGTAVLGRAMNPEEWLEGLRTGWYSRSAGAPFAIRECFPSATMATLRNGARSKEMRELLARPGTMRAEELQIALGWLDHGIKKGRNAIFDRADALIASFSGIPLLGLGYSERELDGVNAKNWRGAYPESPEIEGRIAVLV